MPIILAPVDQELIVKKIILDDKTKKHLESLGITINAKLKIVSSSGGSVIVQVKDSRLALDGNLARKIFVA